MFLGAVLSGMPNNKWNLNHRPNRQNVNETETAAIDQPDIDRKQSRQKHRANPDPPKLAVQLVPPFAQQHDRGQRKRNSNRRQMRPDICGYLAPIGAALSNRGSRSQKKNDRTKRKELLKSIRLQTG